MFEYLLSLFCPLYLTFAAGFSIVFVLRTILRRNLPPGPFSLPLFGSVGFFRAFKRRRHLVLCEYAEKYGNIFTVYAGTQMVVFLNGYETIHQAFVKKLSVFSDRPNWLPSLQNGLSEGKGLVWQDAAHAVLARKFALQALRGFGLGKSSLQEKVLREMNSVSDVLQKHAGQPGQPFHLKSTLKKAVTNVIHEVVFGDRFEYEDNDFENLIFLIDEFFKGGIFISKNFLPKFIYNFLPKDKKEFDRKQKVICDLKRYIYDRISEHGESFNNDCIRDFIDLYLKASSDNRKESSGTIPSKGEIFRIILDLFLAGSETTASTLDWCFMFMVKYPEIQEKCFQEITRLGPCHSDGGCIDWSCKTQLPYIEATLTEVQRLATIVPLGLPHATSEDVTLQGYVIPKNTMVFANIYSCSMDRNVWSNVNEFNPDRHLDEHGQFQRNEKLIPFSIGPRMCLGDSMAKLEIFVFFANLIKRFKFTKHGEGDLSVTHVQENRPLSSTQSFKVIIAERYTSLE